MTNPNVKHYRHLSRYTAIALVKPRDQESWVWRYRYPFGTLDYPAAVATDASDFMVFMASQHVPVNWEDKLWLSSPDNPHIPLWLRLLGMTLAGVIIGAIWPF